MEQNQKHSESFPDILTNIYHLQGEMDKMFQKKLLGTRAELTSL